VSVEFRALHELVVQGECNKDYSPHHHRLHLQAMACTMRKARASMVSKTDLSSKVPTHNQKGADKDGDWRDLLHLDHFDSLEVVQADHNHDCCLSSHRHHLVQELYIVFMGSHENEDEPANGKTNNRP
jgi:hypothetical protein